MQHAPIVPARPPAVNTQARPAHQPSKTHARLQEENEAMRRDLRLCRAAIAAVLALRFPYNLLARQVQHLLAPALRATARWSDEPPAPAPKPAAPALAVHERRPRYCNYCGGDQLLAHPRQPNTMVCRECYNQQPAVRRWEEPRNA